MKPFTTLLVALTALASLAASATATSDKVRDLPTLTSVTTRAPNQLPGDKLAAGVTYRARLFPVGLRITSRERGWLGAQGRTLPANVTTTKPGAYGWIELRHQLGSISMITAYGRTPSVAAVVNGLRSRGGGASYDATTTVRLAGYAGTQFDGQVAGPTHLFVPFTPPSSSARFVPDSYQVTQGEAFRIIVLNVRGKSIVLLVDGEAGGFDALLEKADSLLATLRLGPA
jgi:hypothetical protein